MPLWIICQWASLWSPCGRGTTHLLPLNLHMPIQCWARRSLASPKVGKEEVRYEHLHEAPVSAGPSRKPRVRASPDQSACRRERRRRRWSATAKVVEGIHGRVTHVCGDTINFHYNARERKAPGWCLLAPHRGAPRWPDQGVCDMEMVGRQVQREVYVKARGGHRRSERGRPQQP
jgi:hypothetical protein